MDGMIGYLNEFCEDCGASVNLLIEDNTLTITIINGNNKKQKAIRADWSEETIKNCILDMISTQ